MSTWGTSGMLKLGQEIPEASGRTGQRPLPEAGLGVLVGSAPAGATVRLHLEQKVIHGPQRSFEGHILL